MKKLFNIFLPTFFFKKGIYPLSQSFLLALNNQDLKNYLHYINEQITRLTKKNFRKKNHK